MSTPGFPQLGLGVGRESENEKIERILCVLSVFVALCGMAKNVCKTNRDSGLS